MYHKILVPMALDHDISPQTLQIANKLLAKGGEIIALHVHQALPGTVSAYLDEETIQAGFEKSKALMAQKLAGADNVTAKIVKGHTARSIIDFANENAIDCIVIGSHNPGMSDFFLGSTASRVVRHAKCSVHVQREAT